MSVPYEKIVAEDLNLGYSTVSVTMPAGGSSTGNQIGQHTLVAQAFGASRSTTQTITASTLTTVQLNTEDLDVRGWYDPSTYTWTPLVAGVYLLTAQVSLASFTGTLTVEIYRGATSIAKMDTVRSAATATLNLSVIASANGSTDGFLVKVTHTNSGAVNVSAAQFAGVLLGKAA
jgi:hypothetical protein